MSSGGGQDQELFVAIAALVISVVALIASLLQVAQQYYASAAGYANCDEKVMGKWHATKKRRLRPTEFRFEVQFEAPVIFLCPPTNKSGPVQGQDIIFLTGDEDSRKKSRSELQADGKPQDRDEVMTDKERIHTADNERASWVTLISALQRMEHESRAWQKEQYQKPPRPPRSDFPPPVKPDEVDAVLDEVAKNYTLTAALQSKAKSWDTMPASVKRPYATTTWCHMVEMLALLGVYWLEFDRTHDRYRGEGNGYVITGEKVSDLGVMFTFQVYGKSRFADNRVIPVDEVKELCFGFVPTLYRATSDARRLKFPNDEPRDLSVLQLASRDEFAETLVLIGCNANTVNYLKEKKRDVHLFPVAFEVMGMLGRTLHIENSCFRALPNPTFYRWDTKNFSLSRMLDSYLEQVETANVLRNKNSVVIRQIRMHVKKIQDELELLPPEKEREGSLSLPLLGELHRALDDMDEVLTAREKHSRPPITREATQATQASAHERHDSHSQLLEKDPKKTQEKPRERERRQMVQDVLRSHVQEVLRGINEMDRTDEEAGRAYSPTVASFQTQLKLPLPRFKEIDDAAPEDKQAKLMEVYFQVVRQKVVDRAEKSSTKRRESTAAAGAVPVQGIQKRPTEKSIAEDVAEDDEDSGTTEQAETLWDLPDVKHEDIWCTLVFRMICWLMLHDFHKKDVQKISKSELLGSRLPVYIA